MPQPGTNTGSAPGFLATTVRLCAGTKIMTEIYESSPARAIWRFFLLTILCSIMAAVVGTLVQRSVFERAGRNLDEEIGAFEVTPETISFQKEPGTPRRFKLPYITLEYYPGDTFTSEDFNAGRTSDHGIVILPGGLASWASVNWNGEDLFYATLLPASMLYASLSGGKNADLNRIGAHWEMFSGPGFAETLKKEFAMPTSKKADKASQAEDAAPVSNIGFVPDSMLYAHFFRHASLSGEVLRRVQPGKNTDLNSIGARWERFSGPGFAETLKKEFAPKAKKEDKASSAEDAAPVMTTGSQAASFALSLLTAIILLSTFARNFLEIGLIVLLVSLVQYLRASTLPKGIIFRNVLTIMVYSTFPAQIAATLFDAAGGDRYISFQLLFVGIFFVYQLFAFRAVIRKVCPQIDRKDDDFDDSDF